MKYLGLIVEDHLNWSYHIAELKKKLNRTIAMLYKVKNRGFDISTLRCIYFALSHSYLNYGLNAWGLSEKSVFHKIEVAQNNAIRAIFGIKRHESCSRFFKELRILKS